MIEDVSIKHSGNIWFNEHCAYIGNHTYATKLKSEDYYYDVIYFLKDKLGITVNTEKSIFSGCDSTIWITINNKFSVVIDRSTDFEISTYAVFDINEIEYFYQLDGILSFERFYNQITDALLEIIKEHENESCE